MLRKCKLGVKDSRTDSRRLDVGIVLIEKCFVVYSSRQQSEQPATARMEALGVPVPGVESWSPRGVQTPKSRPVASTGVHGVLG